MVARQRSMKVAEMLTISGKLVAHKVTRLRQVLAGVVILIPVMLMATLVSNKERH